MSRMDVPTLRCDRCGETTQSLTAMSYYRSLNHDHASGRDVWDLCPRCWAAFATFVDGEETDRG